MRAFPEVGHVDPASAGGFSVMARAVRDADRRVVAIAPDALELLRPESDLARLLESFGRADVLLVAEDVPNAADTGDYDGDSDSDPDPDSDFDSNPDRDFDTDFDSDPDDWTRDAGIPDEVRERAAALGHRDLVVHRLGLRLPLAVDDESELIAALSELVGFDPEDGVYCLAPAGSPNSVIARAAQRIAQVYGLPLLRYRCLELSMVDPMIDEAG
jgi:hypothetical protein